MGVRLVGWGASDRFRCVCEQRMEWCAGCGAWTARMAPADGSAAGLTTEGLVCKNCASEDGTGKPSLWSRYLRFILTAVELPVIWGVSRS